MGRAFLSGNSRRLFPPIHGCTAHRLSVIKTIRGKGGLLIINQSRRLDSEERTGFRSSRWCVDHIFTLRRILERRHSYRQPTVVVLLNLKPAFDSVARNVLWSSLLRKGVPGEYVNLLGSLYAHFASRLNVYEQLSRSFITSSGVRLGCPISPLLFSFTMEEILEGAFKESSELDVELLSGARLTDLEYADNIVLLNPSAEGMWTMLNKNMENLLPLLEMGFEMRHLERAYMCGYRTVEEAVAYLAGDLSGSSTEKSPDRLVLRIPNAAAACTSMFTPTRPFHVNLVDQHLASVEKSDLALDESGSSQSPVMAGYGKLDEAFAFQQAEAHKCAADMKSDRIARLRERELLLAEIQAEKESRRWRQPIYNHPNTIDESVTTVVSQTNDTKMASDQLRIRVFPIGSSTDPILLVLSRSAIYADLLSAVQQSVLSNYLLWTNANVDSGSSDITHLDEHLRSLRVTDECVQLIVNTWPRQTLPHCSSLSPSSSSTVTQSDVYLTQSLLDLGLIDGISVHVRHCGACIFAGFLCVTTISCGNVTLFFRFAHFRHVFRNVQFDSLILSVFNFGCNFLISSVPLVFIDFYITSFTNDVCA
ncbi:hypothetical protein EG68_10488 [Paragonimus skrjabini miyazakii]|uniref:Reverse transcriptase domain-containing protein n=1 Tax=Paragonimus skrjabini miyazakii TaxID=59628 RepID=A0A8S9YJP0_9TREM|nr:hypothetical protein EG68_10488 [Paragonimus skrjabini miyazakii]